MTEIRLPKLGFSMEEGQLVAWLAEDGARVEEGQPLYEMEGDKAVQEVEAPASGTLRIIAAVDQIYPVGTLLGEIG
jgi:pyruvate/2-oxoglutarate dehydrogenase complex dihydrolipoamide acyltransferase (E2) component